MDQDKPWRGDARIVLVRPRNPLNIGAAARAMMNFGFTDLAVVSPHSPVWEEARSAVGAQAVLRRARVVSSLLEAVDDRTLVIGASSLSRRKVSQPVISSEEISGLLQKRQGKSRVALVFGSEKSGLSNEDLSYCHMVARIPTGQECPSMNLGQAVAVCCYELRRQGGSSPQHGMRSKGSASPAPVRDIEIILKAVDELRRGGGESLEKTRAERLRQIMLRREITEEEVSIVLGILRDIAWRFRQPS